MWRSKYIVGSQTPTEWQRAVKCWWCNTVFPELYCSRHARDHWRGTMFGFSLLGFLYRKAVNSHITRVTTCTCTLMCVQLLRQKCKHISHNFPKSIKIHSPVLQDFDGFGTVHKWHHCLTWSLMFQFWQSPKIVVLCFCAVMDFS